MKHRAFRLPILCASLVLLVLALLVWPAAGMVLAQAPEPAPLPTPGIAERPDACERNNRREDACNLPLDSVSGPFTFLPAGDQDWYRVDLGQPNGLETRVTVRADDGLDLLVSLSREDGTALASFATPALSTTVVAEIGGPILIRVENRMPRDPAGRAYTVEIRKLLPPPPDPAHFPDMVLPDALENNWDPAHASPIAVNMVYSLTLACPETRTDACPGGDHDYLRFPVKAGTAYLIATFDLGPGVDTVLDLYLDDQLDRPLLSNDDARSSGGLLSIIRWIAPRNGTAYLRIGPRTGGIVPLLGEEAAGAGGYRLVVALGRGALAETIEARIAEQSNVPARPGAGGTNGANPAAPTPGVTATTPISGTGEPLNARIIQGDAIKGQAITLAETTVRLRPQPDGEVIQVLPARTIVSLIGKHSSLWVRVQTEQAVLAGWVLATDLQRYAGDGATPTAPPAQSAMPDPSSTADAPGMTATPASLPTATPAQTGSRNLRVTALPPLPVSERAPPVARVTTAVTVSLRMSSAIPPARTPAPGQRATPIPSSPVVGLRIQLVNAFGDVLAEAIAPASGEVVLARELTPETALFVRLPALGLLTRVSGPQIGITLPEVAWQP